MSTPTGNNACQPAAVTHTQILEQREVAPGIYRLRLACPEIAARALPGQFVMLRLAGRDDPLLARPLAVYDTFPAGNTTPEGIELMYAVHGRFTRSLSNEPAGTPLAVWGPLGNGFSPPPVEHLVLVAGGIGQTALLSLGKERLGVARYGAVERTVAAARRVSFLWGARTAAAFGDLTDFQAAGMETHLATIDGSAGVQGTVIDLLNTRMAAEPNEYRREKTAIACCGPEPMMEAVAAWSERQGLACQVSLETPMACGIGICFTCVAAVRDPEGGWDYRRTCIEGPVFDAASLEWQPC